MTTTPCGAPAGCPLPAPYPFDPSCGHVPMAEVSTGIRAAIDDASCEIRMEMRMLGHVRDASPDDQQLCRDILRALEHLHALGQKLPR